MILQGFFTHLQGGTRVSPTGHAISQMIGFGTHEHGALNVYPSGQAISHTKPDASLLSTGGEGNGEQLHGGTKTKPSRQAMSHWKMGFLMHLQGGVMIWPGGHTRLQMAMGGSLTQEQGGLKV